MPPSGCAPRRRTGPEGPGWDLAPTPTSTFGHEASSLACTPIEKPHVAKGRKPKLSAGVNSKSEYKRDALRLSHRAFGREMALGPLALRLSSIFLQLLSVRLRCLPSTSFQQTGKTQVHGLNVKATRISPINTSGE